MGPSRRFGRGALGTLAFAVVATQTFAQDRILTPAEIAQYSAEALTQLDRAIGKGTMSPVAAAKAVATSWEKQKQECLLVAASAYAKERCSDMVIYGNVSAAKWLGVHQADGEAIFATQTCVTPPGSTRRCFDPVVLPPSVQGTNECRELSKKFASTAANVTEFTCLRRESKADPWQPVFVARGGVVL